MTLEEERCNLLFQFICVFVLKVYYGTAADLRMVGVALHQSSVIVANLYLALVTAQWVSESSHLPTFNLVPRVSLLPFPRIFGRREAERACERR